MLYLYLDESGDLGFDFFTKRPSKYFTLAVLTVSGIEDNRRLISAVRKTIKRKLPRKQVEMKGAKDSIEGSRSISIGRFQLFHLSYTPLL